MQVLAGWRSPGAICVVKWPVNIRAMKSAEVRAIAVKNLVTIKRLRDPQKPK